MLLLLQGTTVSLLPAISPTEGVNPVSRRRTSRITSGRVWKNRNCTGTLILYLLDFVLISIGSCDGSHSHAISALVVSYIPTSQYDLCSKGLGAGTRVLHIHVCIFRHVTRHLLVPSFTLFSPLMLPQAISTPIVTMFFSYSTTGMSKHLDAECTVRRRKSILSVIRGERTQSNPFPMLSIVSNPQ